MFKRIVVGLVVLGAMVLYISQVELKNDKAQALVEKPFADLKPAHTKSVSIRSDSSDFFELVNSKPTKGDDSAASSAVTDGDISNWGISNINGAELDLTAINSLFSALQGLNLKDGIPSSDIGDDKSVYGLSPSQLTVKVADINNVTREINLGKINEYMSQRYLQIDGDPGLYLVSSALFDAAAKKRDDFRNHLPLIIFEGDVKQLTIADNYSSTNYVFEQSNRWKMTAPQQVSVSSDVINQVFQAIRSVRAVEFVDDINNPEKQAQFGLSSPMLTISVQYKDEKKPAFEARFGAFRKNDGKKNDEADSYIVYRVGSNYGVTFTSEIKSQVVKPIIDYRERKLASFDTSDVKSVLVKKGDSTISITRNSAPVPTPAPDSKTRPAYSIWLVNDKPGDEPFISGYFDTLSKMDAKHFLEKGSSNLGFDAPFGSVEITLNTGAVRKIIVGAPHDEQERTIGVDDLSEPFTVDEKLINRILPSLESLIDVPEAKTESAGSSSSEGEKTE